MGESLKKRERRREWRKRKVEEEEEEEEHGSMDKAWRDVDGAGFAVGPELVRDGT